MIELDIKYPATTAKPKPSGPGKVIHSYVDLTPHQNDEARTRYFNARTDEERDAALRDMPNATVTFHELPEGEPFFDMVDRERDKNGFAIWDTVWIKDAKDYGTIEAAYGDEYDVSTGDIDNPTRLRVDQIKPFDDMTDEEAAALDRMAAEERDNRAEAAAGG